MKKNVKVSIIVPIYNSEKYLERCLDSLLNQTLKSIEIILINDGSTDKSDSIVKKYLNSKKIKYIKTNNNGASYARNCGLDVATGEYIGFVDSDDFVKPNMFKLMYKEAKLNNSDIVCCSYFKYLSENEKTKRKFYKGAPYNKNIYENPKIFYYSVPYLWNKIFKKELIENNNIFFKDFRIFEDLNFTYKLYFCAQKISYINKSLYYYQIDRPNSLTFSFSKKFFDVFESLDDLYKFSPKIKDYVNFLSMKHILLRFDENYNKKNLLYKLFYIRKSFNFLNKNVKNWKDNDYFFERFGFDKKIYTSEIYWYIDIIKKLI